MTSRKRKKRRAYRLGYWAEYRAAFALVLRGYRIVAMRYKTKQGEIDLVIRKGDLVCFVEVKARKTVDAAIDSVGYATQKRIRNAADLWLGRQADAARLSMRFDIVAVCPWKWPVHFRDAF